MNERILQKRIVPVIVLDSVDDAEPLAEALLAAGLDIMEITFRTEAAAECIERIRDKFPDLLVGAGTLLHPEQVMKAEKAGAKFGVSPGLNRSVVERAMELELPFFPGVMTPTDIERALSLGCRMLKFFPAHAAGGPAALQALAGPYTHTGVKFIPTGGVNASNMADYLKPDVVAAIGGSWMVDRKLIQAGDWQEVTRQTRLALSIAAS